MATPPGNPTATPSLPCTPVWRQPSSAMQALGMIRRMLLCVLVLAARVRHRRCPPVGGAAMFSSRTVTSMPDTAMEADHGRAERHTRQDRVARPGLSGGVPAIYAHRVE